MKFISPRFHGLMDYATAAAMIVLPRQLGFSTPTTNLMIGAGAGILGMSLLTRYPMGLVPVLPMKAHLVADAAMDALLIREANQLEKSEPKARNAILGLAIAGTLLTLFTRSRQ